MMARMVTRTGIGADQRPTLFTRHEVHSSRRVSRRARRGAGQTSALRTAMDSKDVGTFSCIGHWQRAFHCRERKEQRTPTNRDITTSFERQTLRSVEPARARAARIASDRRSQAHPEFLCVCDRWLLAIRDVGPSGPRAQPTGISALSDPRDKNVTACFNTECFWQDALGQHALPCSPAIPALVFSTVNTATNSDQRSALR